MKKKKMAPLDHHWQNKSIKEDGPMGPPFSGRFLPAKYSRIREPPVVVNYLINEFRIKEPPVVVNFKKTLNSRWFSGRNPINKYPQFIMGLLAQAKNGDQQFWK